MDKFFKEWLEICNDFDFYNHADEEIKRQYFLDYQWEYYNDNKEIFTIWMINDPESVMIKFPDVYESAIKKINSKPVPESIISFYYKFPSEFKLRVEYLNNQLLKTSKLKTINFYIIFISNLIESEHYDIAIKHSIQSISESLQEELSYWRLQYEKLLVKTNNSNVDLSPVEIAIRHYILVKADIEKSLTPKELALKNPQKSFDNIRKALPIIEKKARNNESLGTTQQLKNVMNSLNAYPDQQAKIIEMINRFN